MSWMNGSPSAPNNGAPANVNNGSSPYMAASPSPAGTNRSYFYNGGPGPGTQQQQTSQSPYGSSYGGSNNNRQFFNGTYGGWMNNPAMAARNVAGLPNGATAAASSSDKPGKISKMLSKIGGKTKGWYRDASKDTKQAIGIVGALGVAAIIIAVLVFIYKHKKKVIDAQYEKDKQRMVEETRKSAGLSGATVPPLPGDVYERHVSNMMKQVQTHHDRALKSQHPVYCYEEICRALGILDSISDVVHEDLVFQLTNINMQEYRRILISLKSDTMVQFGKISPLLKQQTFSPLPLTPLSPFVVGPTDRQMHQQPHPNKLTPQPNMQQPSNGFQTRRATGLQDTKKAVRFSPDQSSSAAPPEIVP